MLALLFDTETSGLIANHSVKIDKQPSVIEFYGCLADLSTGEIVNELDLLIKPPLPITAEITGITHITNDMLTGKPSFAALAEDIKDFIEDNRASALIAHNLSFDMEMTEIEFERLGLQIMWPPRLICTVEQTIHLKGFRLNLSGLHEFLFDEPMKEAHRAKVDVVSMLRCCVELFRRGEL